MQARINSILSLITIFIIFGLHMMVGFLYGEKELFDTKWSVVNQFYYWIVTFTTVGFGDMSIPIEIEVDHMKFTLIYRLFGLAIIAAIIGDIKAVVKAHDIRKLKSIKKSSVVQRKRKYGTTVTDGVPNGGLV